MNITKSYKYNNDEDNKQGQCTNVACICSVPFYSLCFQRRLTHKRRLQSLKKKQAQYPPCNVRWNAVSHAIVFSLCDIICYGSFIGDEGALSALQSWKRARIAHFIELVSSVVFYYVP